MMIADLPEGYFLVEQATRLLKQDVRAVLVQVTASRGSVPRQQDAASIVTATHVYGTIGGGHLEFAAIAEARHLLNLSVIQEHRKSYSLGASLGQCCGGAVELQYSQLQAQHLDCLNQVPQRYKTLYLFGAGHVARALVNVLKSLPLKIIWIESRATINQDSHVFPSQLPNHVQTVISDVPEAELANAILGDLCLIMTHSHQLDEEITQYALKNAQLSYVGLIGSHTKRRLFQQRLTARGLPQASFDRLTCPIGNADRFSPQAIKKEAFQTQSAYRKQPSVIAVQVASELLAFL